MSEFDINEDNVSAAERALRELTDAGEHIDGLREAISGFEDDDSWHQKAGDLIYLLRNLESPLAEARERVDEMLDAGLEDAVEAHYDQEK